MSGVGGVGEHVEHRRVLGAPGEQRVIVRTAAPVMMPARDTAHRGNNCFIGVQGRILAILAETTAELNLRTIARLADVSPAQTSRVLPEAVALGLVERREAPPSALYTLVEDHVAARAVRALSRSRDAVLEELGTLARKMDPRPVSAVVFGSFARGDADAASDLDIVLVRPAGVGEDAEPWRSSAEAWRTAARRLTGNPVQVLEVDEAEAARRLRRPTSLWEDVLRDGITVHGSPLANPRGRRSA